MTPEHFQAWAAQCGLRSDSEIARAIGIHRNSVLKYRKHGIKPPSSKLVRLAMAAYSANLDPYESETQ